MSIFDFVGATTLSILITLIIGVYTYIKWRYTYWERNNFPSIPPKIPFGNLENPFARKTPPAIELKNFYNRLKSEGAKHGGIYSFSTPVYIPVDLDYIKNILSRDFQHFVERGRYYNERDDPLSAHLFNIGGAKWRKLRVKFTPTFTSGKMKTMFATLLHCVKPLLRAVEECRAQNGPVEVKGACNRFTIEVIGNCVFGIECDAFGKVDSDFPKYGKMFLKGNLKEAFRQAFIFSFPDLSRFLRIRRFEKEVTDFFMDFITSTVKYRETNDVRRNDFLQILIDLKNNAEGGEGSGRKTDGNNLTMDELAAQAVVFFIAGFDTSATAMSFTLFELARNPEVQQKVRDEINEVVGRHGGELNYEALSELKYMQQVLDETLRKYPSLPILNRQCVDTYQIPDSDLVLEKGTQIIIPLMGLHHDPEYFPDPEKYDPDRFSPENKGLIKPFSYLPFGDGPRNCIGLRFGTMQSKVGLSMLLKDYKYTVNPQTSIPLQLELGLMCCAKGGIWLDVTKVN